MLLIRNVAIILVIIGGLNWGLVGFFNFDLVSAVFGPMSYLSRLVYSLVGISALALIFMPGCSIREAIKRK